MRLADFDVPFDPSLIAERPVEPRDQARLLVVPRHGGDSAHRRVADLPALLEPGDLLVVNDTRVLAARLTGRKRSGGGHVELVLVKDLGGNTWEVLLKGRVRPGHVIDLPEGASATVLAQDQGGTTLRFEGCASAGALLRAAGQMPLPPYIKRAPTEADRAWYQTVFARQEGAVAAPTAGLHFTDSLLAALRAREIGLATVTLHVGPATFRPVTVEDVEQHPMGVEWCDVPEETARTIARTKAKRGRVVAVGTTVVRSLETAAKADGIVHPYRGGTSLFILPGYQFRAIDVLLTNFHLPRTTLVMLVAAFAGLDRVREAYRIAIAERYRFYSYGDGMLII
jgi:S-adenosylmethionine:tRNA ribosyltransferase-isomerase